MIVEKKCFDSTGVVVPCIKYYEASETNFDELSHLMLINRDTLILKSTGKPITGIIYRLHENGNWAWQCNYVNGIENGIANVWYDNGKINIIEKWKNGVQVNREGIGFVVENAEQLSQKIKAIDNQEELKQKIDAFMQSQAGAADKIVHHSFISKILNQN